MADAARCDHCSTHADRPARDRFMHRTYFGEPAWLPEGWVLIHGAQDGGLAESTADGVRGEFCGWLCAAHWLTNVAWGRAGGDPSGVTP